MKNNKGFTLIELIVCMLIFGIIVVAVFGFMISGAKDYNSLNGRADIQMDSQLTMNFLSNYLMNCDEAIYIHKTDSETDETNKIDTICIIDKASSGYIAYVFRYVDADSTLYFSQSTSVTANADGSFACSMGSQNILSNSVRSFSATKTEETKDGSNMISAVNLELSFMNHSTEKKCSQTVALRNKPTAVSATITYTEQPT